MDLSDCDDSGFGVGWSFCNVEDLLGKAVATIATWSFVSVSGNWASSCMCRD